MTDTKTDADSPSATEEVAKKHTVEKPWTPSRITSDMPTMQQATRGGAAISQMMLSQAGTAAQSFGEWLITVDEGRSPAAKRQKRGVLAERPQYPLPPLRN